MTLDSTTSKVQYTQSGTTTAWPVPYKFLDNGDLIVITTVDGVDTALVLDTDYTVTGAGDDAGGTVTISPAVASGTRVTIYREIDLDQPTELTTAGGWFPKVHEAVFDRLTMQIQQVNEVADRALRLAVTSTIDPEAAIDDVFTARDDAQAAASDAEASAIRAEIASSTVAYYNHEGTLLTGEDTISLPWAYDTEVGVEVYLGGVKQAESSLIFTDAYTVTLDTPVTADTPFEVVASAGARSDLANLLASSAGSALVGFLQDGTGATARTVQAKLLDVVSVKDFGAVGDGVADDAVSINAAISYVNANGGGAVYFPSGIYRVKSSIQYLAGADLIGESMGNTTLKWHPDTNTTGSILDTSNQYLNRARFENLRFTKDSSITTNTTGILGGSTLANYNSAIACFENLHFDGLTYGIRGNAEPTGVGLFDCYFKNIWCSGCFFGLWLFGSGNRVDQPRMTLCDTAVALDYLNAESYDGMTVTGGTWVGNVYDIGVLNVNGIRPTKFIGCWYETSTAGVINILNPGTRVMNLDFIGCMLSTSSVTVMFNAVNAVGTVSLDRCTLISGGVGKAQNFVRPTAPGGRLIVKDCQKYDESGIGSFVSDANYFEAVKGGINQSIPSSTYTKLTWSTATLDTAGGFDNSNDSYVIPVKGVYRICANVGFDPHTVSTNNNIVLVFKNGGFQRTSLGASNSTAQTNVFINCLLKCDFGDVIDIRVIHGNASAVNVLGANDLTRFTVEYVGN